MAQTIFVSILTLAVFLSPLCLAQSAEGISAWHEVNQTLNGISENSEGYPTGCKLYQSRKLLQCRNAGLRAIPELNENWNVKTVDLSSNNISTLQFGDGYRNVKSISIGDNPLHCDCKLQWLRERLLGSNNQYPHIRHIQDLTCNTPARLQGIKLATISEEELCGAKPEDILMRSTTAALTEKEEKSINSTAQAEFLEEQDKARNTREKGRVVEIIGVTCAFAATIVIMSVAFIVM